jgi:hypothetical protein
MTVRRFLLTLTDKDGGETAKAETAALAEELGAYLIGRGARMRKWTLGREPVNGLPQRMVTFQMEVP